MRIVHSGVFLIGAVFFLTSACYYSPTIKTPDKEEDPFKGTSVDPKAGPVNEPPPPRGLSEPDMDFIKDMLRRSADQAAQCDVKENSGPRGTAHLEVSFTPNGRVDDITLYPPHEGTSIGDCIARSFEGIFVTSWEGINPVKVERKVDFSKKKQDPTP